MSVLVVDASVAAKWFIEEEHADAALLVLDERNDLHAPDFFFLEMDNVFCRWIRRGDIPVADGQDLRQALRRCPVHAHPFSSLLDLAFSIANETRRSLYDCLYLALADALDGRMVTADRRLYDALTGGPLAGRVVWVGDVRTDEGGEDEE